jgi:hypothetical protein
MTPESSGSDTAPQKKSVFDHPELAGLTIEQKVAYATHIAGLKDPAWDAELLLIPMNPTNRSQINVFTDLCQRNAIPLKDVTQEMDPDSTSPMYRYFLLEDSSVRD